MNDTRIVVVTLSVVRVGYCEKEKMQLVLD